MLVFQSSALCCSACVMSVKTGKVICPSWLWYHWFYFYREKWRLHETCYDLSHHLTTCSLCIIRIWMPDTYKDRDRKGRGAERIKTERQSQNYSNYSKEKPLACLFDTLSCNLPNILCYYPSRQRDHYNTYTQPQFKPLRSVGLWSFDTSYLMCFTMMGFCLFMNLYTKNRKYWPSASQKESSQSLDGWYRQCLSRITWWLQLKFPFHPIKPKRWEQTRTGWPISGWHHFPYWPMLMGANKKYCKNDLWKKNANWNFSIC